MSATGENATRAPFLQVVRGEPTAEEIAALAAVLTARAQAAAAARARAEERGARRVSRWADRSRQVGGPVSEGLRPRGPGAWRASAFPR
ncbi:acyl-CoA carboxylase subunit epsilon [Actinomadura rudentiformis]|uniref:Acyl-CoA carboxylase subunit epsilon n=1 Tax=Actinomadura rudentiformis TaxID=359158 RepID=A0A6H9YTF2_9ACTN|nr:acyl-CoA carboxylase subunit epsilon [Actinomadura rudentiformis]KAB2351640.1 acyl-CoA carboxylase subunit epsilon [Actinomadura rudentiformis]